MITVLLGIAIPLGVIGGIGLTSTMSVNGLDRIREFGVMRAVGARPRTVRRIVVAEVLFLALTSCVARSCRRLCSHRCWVPGWATCS